MRSALAALAGVVTIGSPTGALACELLIGEKTTVVVAPGVEVGTICVADGCERLKLDRGVGHVELRVAHDEPVWFTTQAAAQVCARQRAIKENFWNGALPALITGTLTIISGLVGALTIDTIRSRKERSVLMADWVRAYRRRLELITNRPDLPFEAPDVPKTDLKGLTLMLGAREAIESLTEPLTSNSTMEQRREVVAKAKARLAALG